MPTPRTGTRRPASKATPEPRPKPAPPAKPVPAAKPAAAAAAAKRRVVPFKSTAVTLTGAAAQKELARLKKIPVVASGPGWRVRNRTAGELIKLGFLQRVPREGAQAGRRAPHPTWGAEDEERMRAFEQRLLERIAPQAAQHAQVFINREGVWALAPAQHPGGGGITMTNFFLQHAGFTPYYTGVAAGGLGSSFAQLIAPVIGQPMHFMNVLGPYAGSHANAQILMMQAPHAVPAGVSPAAQQVLVVGGAPGAVHPYAQHFPFYFMNGVQGAMQGEMPLLHPISGPMPLALFHAPLPPEWMNAVQQATGENARNAMFFNQNNGNQILQMLRQRQAEEAAQPGGRREEPEEPERPQRPEADIDEIIRQAANHGVDAGRLRRYIQHQLDYEQHLREPLARALGRPAEPATLHPQTIQRLVQMAATQRGRPEWWVRAVKRNLSAWR